MKDDKITPSSTRPQRPVLVVRATFEESRMAGVCLATAYEHAMPLRQRNATARRPSASRTQGEGHPLERMGS